MKKNHTKVDQYDEQQIENKPPKYMFVLLVMFIILLFLPVIVLILSLLYR